MMNLIDHGKSRMGTEEFGADLPMTQEESFVKAVYSSVDEAVARVSWIGCAAKLASFQAANWGVATAAGITSS